MIRTTKALAAVLVVFASLSGCSTEPAKPAAGAYAEAVEWLYDPANRAEALQIFVRNQPNATQQSAETAYRVLLDPKDGFQRRAQIDLQGVANVLAIRTKWAEKKMPLAQPGAYYDPSFYDQAVGR